jgi:glycine/D-amino acid oxidase-like deaminating enzyme
MSKATFDTLIVGQGLAGSALAWHLIHAGHRVCVVDDRHATASSMVAAGLVNPLAGMRFNRRPELPDWLAAADRWYAELEKAFDRRLFHPLPMLRLFRSAKQRRFYARRAQDPASQDLLGAAFAADGCPEPIRAPDGGFAQYRTGYVDLPRLLQGMRAWLDNQGCLVERELASAQIECSARGVHADGLQARRLIFCDGARLRFNRWFGGLPLAPDKGEILDLEIPDWRTRHIINGAYWLVPLDNGEVRLGATHEHRQLDDRPTDAARQLLLAGLAELLPAAVTSRVVRQQTGIRPATSDRYPLIGAHPEFPRLWVFNGFGAHGALRAPWYAQRLTAHLQSAEPLPAEADIRRFR